MKYLTKYIFLFSHGRGRGRGHRGSRGRSFSDDGRDVPEGGRGTYSGRGYYSENRGGYHGTRGGRGMGRGGYVAQDRTGSSSHSSENNSDRHSAENSHLGIRGSSAGGIHVNNDRRDINTGSNIPGSSSGEAPNYAGHSTHQEGRSQGNISSSSGSAIHGHSTKFTPAPEFEMKGNDFPALPGAGETAPRKASESSDGASAWGEANRYIYAFKMLIIVFQGKSSF